MASSSVPLRRGDDGDDIEPDVLTLALLLALPLAGASRFEDELVNAFVSIMHPSIREILLNDMLHNFTGSIRRRIGNVDRRARICQS